MRMRFVVSLIVAVTLAACAQQPVSVDFEPTVDLSSMSSYGWAIQGPAAFGAANDGLMDRRVKEVLGEELAMRGLVFEPHDPDMRVGYQVRDEQKVDVYRYPAFHSWGHRHLHYGYHDELAVYRYEQRRFILDVMDGEHNLIWRGVYKGVLKQAATPEERTARIKDQVREILVYFPR